MITFWKHIHHFTEECVRISVAQTYTYALKGVLWLNPLNPLWECFWIFKSVLFSWDGAHAFGRRCSIIPAWIRFRSPRCALCNRIECHAAGFVLFRGYPTALVLERCTNAVASPFGVTGALQHALNIQTKANGHRSTLFNWFVSSY